MLRFFDLKCRQEKRYKFLAFKKYDDLTNMFEICSQRAARNRAAEALRIPVPAIAARAEAILEVLAVRATRPARRKRLRQELATPTQAPIVRRVLGIFAYEPVSISLNFSSQSQREGRSPSQLGSGQQCIRSRIQNISLIRNRQGGGQGQRNRQSDRPKAAETLEKFRFLQR